MCVWLIGTPSIHRFILSGKVGLGSSCAAIVLLGLVVPERQKTLLRRRSTGSYSRVLVRVFSLSLFIIIRSFKRKGSSSSKEPRFVLEDAIHASESTSRGVNVESAHVFEVRMCKWMDDPIRSSSQSDRMRVYRSPWSLLAIRTRSLPYFGAMRRTSIRKQTRKAEASNGFWYSRLSRWAFPASCVNNQYVSKAGSPLDGTNTLFFRATRASSFVLWVISSTLSS